METSVDKMYRKLILECTFDTSKNIYEDCILKQKEEFKRFFDLGVLAQFQSKENLKKEESFEYWYNKYLSE